MARFYIKTPSIYETHSWVDVISSTKVHEDNIFVEQDLLQFITNV